MGTLSHQRIKILPAAPGEEETQIGLGVDPGLAFEPREIGRDGDAKRCSGVVARHEELGSVHLPTASPAESDVKAANYVPVLHPYRHRRHRCLGAPRSHQSTAAPSRIMPTLNSASERLQNFHSSFAARLY